MSKIKTLVNSELAAYIKQNFPVIKKRTALWFFTNELKNNLTFSTSVANGRIPVASDYLDSGGKNNDPLSTSSTLNQPSQSKKPSKDDKPKISRNKILWMWRNMDPESKRKYFNMAEFDEIRFEEQKSQWVSEVGELMQKHGGVAQLSEMAPSHERLQNKFLVSLDRLQKNYEQMIQTESTRMIYKDAIKQATDCPSALSADQLISSVPAQHRPILTKPRRPPPAYVLYLSDNMDRFKRIRLETETKDNCMRICANEWNNLSEDVKLIYEDRYSKLKSEYDESMELYRSTILTSSDDYILSATREKKAFKKSLKRRLRKSTLLPLSIRNAFNFFVMENKDAKLADLTEVWRDMPDEAKLKYVKMNQEDVTRYYREIEAYNEVRKILSDIARRRSNH